MAFASTADVEARRGSALTVAETETATFLLAAAQAVIEEVVDKDEAAIGTIPPVLKYMTVEKVVRAMANPQGLASQSETLGAYAHTERFNSAANTDLLLTKLEENIVRKAVHGRLSGSAEPASLASDEFALGQVAPASYPWVGELEEGS